jgi:hypothetical protein
MTREQKLWLDNNKPYEIIGRGGLRNDMDWSPARNFRDTGIVMPDGTFVPRGRIVEGAMHVGIRVPPGQQQPQRSVR